MVRSFIMLLLVAVIFLTGMLLGVDRGQKAIIHDKTDVDDSIQLADETTDLEETQEKQDKIYEQETTENMMNMQAPEHFTQKMAASLETVVKGFYEMIVQIFYQIAQLFF